MKFYTECFTANFYNFLDQLNMVKNGATFENQGMLVIFTILVILVVYPINILSNWTG